MKLSIVLILVTIVGTCLAQQDTARAQASSTHDTSITAAEQPAAAPFAFGDFTWLNGNTRQNTSIFDSNYFTGEFRADVSYIEDFNQPVDHTLSGTSESGRTSEIQVQQLGIGGDFHVGHALGRLMTQFGK